MGRPREYDEEEVLRRAQEVFWTRGYEATSISDLMEATGLAKGSVYKAFGDKRSLFLRTLEHYLQQGRATYGALDDGRRDTIAILRDWLMAGVSMATEASVKKGCFGVNCIIELAPHDDDVRERMRAHNGRLEAMYAATIARGQREGSVRGELDPLEAASFINTVLAGLQVAGKTGLTPQQGRAMVEMGLSTLRVR